MEALQKRLEELHKGIPAAKALEAEKVRVAELESKARIVGGGGLGAMAAGIVSTAVGAEAMKLTSTSPAKMRNKMSDEEFALWQMSKHEAKARELNVRRSQARVNSIRQIKFGGHSPKP